MRDSHLQTPQKDHTPANRRSKSVTDHTKNTHKASQKCLNSVFTAVSDNESLLSESPKESIDFSISENSIASASPGITNSSKVVPLSDISPSMSSSSSSSVITCDKDIAAIDSNTESKKSKDVNSEKQIGSLEADIVIKHLRNARIEVTNSNDLDRSKKLLDALINVVVDEVGGSLYEENDWIDELVSSSSRLVILCILLGIFAILLVLLIHYGGERAPTGPPPT